MVGEALVMKAQVRRSRSEMGSRVRNGTTIGAGSWGGCCGVVVVVVVAT